MCVCVCVCVCVCARALLRTPLQYRAYRKSWGINAMGSVIVEVETEDHTVGVGEENSFMKENVGR